jgi:predicted DNA-binding transcriptional regulator YafY
MPDPLTPAPAPDAATPAAALGPQEQAPDTGDPMAVIVDCARRLVRAVLTYVDTKGEMTTREIEPYSLRTSSSGAVRLMAMDVAKQQMRGFLLTQIISAQPTQHQWAPQWPVEL